MKKLITFLLLCSTICFSDLITTFEFDIEESTTLSYLRPGWGNTNETFYYNLAYFTVDTGGDWTAANTSIISHDSFNYTNTNLFQQVPWYAADTYVYLYDGPFIPAFPSLNLIAEDDDSYEGGNDYQFDLTYNIKKDHVYWAVITTYDPEEEIEGVVSIYGPRGANINITTIPEPYAAGLIMTGGAMLLYIKRKFLTEGE
jgi:hypothetical protein